VIVTDTTGAGSAANLSEETVRWGCLARRGMLYSECEAVDYLEVAPQAAVTSRGRSGTVEAWYVLAGQADFDDSVTERSERVGPGSLVLRSDASSSTVHNPCSNTPLRLLLIAVLPPAVTDRLPQRRPSIDRKLR
jgi:mannose-6-phosphate isomerase-like protein (cupin superfamily)